MPSTIYSFSSALALSGNINVAAILAVDSGTKVSVGMERGWEWPAIPSPWLLRSTSSSCLQPPLEPKMEQADDQRHDSADDLNGKKSRELGTTRRHVAHDAGDRPDTQQHGAPQASDHRPQPEAPENEKQHPDAEGHDEPTGS